jgi:hypothetical protein
MVMRRGDERCFFNCLSGKRSAEKFSVIDYFSDPSDDAGILFVDVWYDFCFIKLAITVFA